MSKFYLILFIIILIFLKYKRNIKGGKKIVIIKEKYTYHEIENVFNKSECNIIINLAKNHLVRSLTIGDKINNIRTSYQTWLNDNNQNVINFTTKLHKLINTYSNTKLYYENTEQLQVVRYKKGQEYKPHYDVCNPYGNINEQEKIECKKDLEKMKSLRYATILVYLNDDFTGGETIFPKLNIKIKPKIGKVLIFYSLDSKQNTILDSFHGGLPITSGVKWICNKWYRMDTVK